MSYHRPSVSLILLAGLALAGSAARAGSAEFKLKTTPTTTLKCAWVKDCDDSSKVVFSGVRDVQTKDPLLGNNDLRWISKKDSSDNHETWITVGMSGSTYTGEVSGWTFSFDVSLVVEGRKAIGGALTGTDVLRMKQGMTETKTNYTVEHKSGNPVLRVEGNTIQVID